MKWLVLTLLMLPLVGPTSLAPATAAQPLATAETLVGAWTGHWVSEGPARQGEMGLVLARTPGNNEVVGQFTFITGGVTRSVRYQGRLTDGRVEFPLVGDGHIVLEPVDAPRPGHAARLRGEWTDVRGALPAPEGVIDLTRSN